MTPASKAAALRALERRALDAGESFLAFTLRCRAAMAQGFMTEHAPRVISGGDYIFTVTEAGRRYVAAKSPAAPRVSRSRARYLAFIEADSGLTFGKWLRAGAGHYER